MTLEEWDGWNRANQQQTNMGARASTPCVDCLPAFSVEMRGVGLCDGVPGEAGTVLVDFDKRAQWRLKKRRQAARVRVGALP